LGSVVGELENVGFEVRDVESLREHYARTLRAWVQSLEASWEQAVVLTSPGRARVWRLYMAGSALTFEAWANRISVHQALAIKPGPGGASGLPLTRAEWLGG
jgi:cyclopropane-fatty-acyl-phospholipid synthase